MTAMAQMVLAIDPGTTHSAYVVYRAPDILQHARVSNIELLRDIRTGSFGDCQHMAIEMIASYGMAVGAEVFRTCVWVGRFQEAWHNDFTEVLRREVKLHLCNSPRAKDANVRQALLDRFGPPGTKKSPGRTYGIAKDVWQALGVAVTWHDNAASTSSVRGLGGGDVFQA